MDIAKIEVKYRTDIEEKLVEGLNTYKEFNLCSKEHSIKVKLSADNYVELIPSPTSERWDYTYFNDYKKEICSAIKNVIFKNKNIVHLSTVSSSDFESRGAKLGKWFFDKRTQKVFYIESYENRESVLLRNDFGSLDLQDDAEDALEDAKDRFGIDRKIIDDDYILSDDDLAIIKNTDVTPEEFLRVIKSYYKGKIATKRLAQRALGEMTYHYKYYFKCDKCGKDSWTWFKHDPMAFIDHFGPFFCPECKDAHEKEQAKLEKLHKFKMKTDRLYRENFEKGLAVFPINIGNVSPILSSIPIEEKPMEPPTDRVFYAQPIFSKTKR